MRSALLLMLLLAALPARAEGVLEALAPIEGGLRVETVIARAIDRAPAVLSARADEARARRKVELAWLLYTPRLDLSAGYTRLSDVEQPTVSFVPERLIRQFGLDPAEFSGGFPIFLDHFSLRADLNVHLSDLLLRSRRIHEATLIEHDITRLRERGEQATVALRAVEAYVLTLRTRAQAAGGSASVDTLGRVLAELEALSGAGLASRVDGKRVEARLARAKVGVERARGAIRVAETMLAQLIHAAPGERLAHGETIFVPPAGPEPDFAEAALATRPELAAIEQRIRLHEELAAARVVGLFPRLVLRGNAEAAQPSQRVFPQQEELIGTWSLGVGVSWSPNDYVAEDSARLDSLRDAAKARADLDALREAIGLGAKDAASALEAALGSIGAARESLDAAKIAFDERAALVAAGQSSTTELLETEADLRASELDWVNAHLDALLARARLDHATGRILDRSTEKQP